MKRSRGSSSSSTSSTSNKKRRCSSEETASRRTRQQPVRTSSRRSTRLQSDKDKKLEEITLKDLLDARFLQIGQRFLYLGHVSVLNRDGELDFHQAGQRYVDYLRWCHRVNPRSVKDSRESLREKISVKFNPDLLPQRAKMYLHLPQKRERMREEDDDSFVSVPLQTVVASFKQSRSSSPHQPPLFVSPPHQPLSPSPPSPASPSPSTRTREFPCSSPCLPSSPSIFSPVLSAPSPILSAHSSPPSSSACSTRTSSPFVLPPPSSCPSSCTVSTPSSPFSISSCPSLPSSKPQKLKRSKKMTKTSSFLPFTQSQSQGLSPVISEQSFSLSPSLHLSPSLSLSLGQEDEDVTEEIDVSQEVKTPEKPCLQDRLHPTPPLSSSCSTLPSQSQSLVSSFPFSSASSQQSQVASSDRYFSNNSQNHHNLLSIAEEDEEYQLDTDSDNTPTDDCEEAPPAEQQKMESKLRSQRLSGECDQEEDVEDEL